jgi:hypothetical protein
MPSSTAGPQAVSDSSNEFVSKFQRPASFTMASRPMTSDRSRSPGPGAYNTRDAHGSAPSSTMSSAHAFSKSERVTTLAAASRRASETPAPGHYGSSSAVAGTSRPSSPAWSMRPRLHDVLRSASPGPSYSPNSSCMPSLDLPSQPTPVMGKFDHRAFEQQNMRNTSPGPGPGKYAPPSAFGGRSMYNSSGGSRMQGRPRSCLGDFPATPGPYPVHNAANLGRAAARFGAAPRKLMSDSVTGGPGPGAYGANVDGKGVGSAVSYTMGRSQRPSIAHSSATSSGPGPATSASMYKRTPTAQFGTAGRFKYPRASSPAPDAYGPIASNFLHRPVYTL